MSPMLWWWRWWVGDDPNSDRQLTEARDLLDEQRTRVDDLGGQLQARDRELDEARSRADAAEGQLQAGKAALDQQRTRAEELDGQLRAKDRELDELRVETEQLRARVAELEAGAADGAAADGTDGPPDVEAAHEILGSKVTADDLTLVEGVGPKIAGLLSDAGIDTWAALGDADVERLRLVLAEAGPRYRMHDPSSWPTQGRLLAAGRWQDFKELSSG